MFPTDKVQRERLISLKDGGGYGILCILQQPGGVCFAASPVPALVGYEIVCASPERTYDIWKDGRLVTPNQTHEQIRSFIQENTPEWLYDDSETTPEQTELVVGWLQQFKLRYPGPLAVGD